MPPKVSQFWEGYVTALSDAKFSYSAIITACRKRGFTISKKGVHNVLAGVGLARTGQISGTEKQANPRTPISRTKTVIQKVKKMVTGNNPATQRTIGAKVGTSLRTVNKIIHKDLGLQKRHKSKVHKLLPKHISERKTNCRKLYERHLAGDKWKYVATLDEAYVYLSDCNKPRAIFYRPVGAKSFPNWYRECRETFSKGFMIVAGYSYQGKLQIRRVAQNVKVNSAYYQDHVLTPIYTQELPALYGNDVSKVRLHQDKASSHTSKSTQNFLTRMEQQTGIQAIPFTEIPVKSPDASPMDFCAFGLLKRALGRRRPRSLDGLWKCCQQEWQRISLPVLRSSLLQWKLRCRAIAVSHGHQIEHDRWWRKGISGK